MGQAVGEASGAADPKGTLSGCTASPLHLCAWLSWVSWPCKPLHPPKQLQPEPALDQTQQHVKLVEKACTHHDEFWDQVHVIVAAGAQLRGRLLPRPEPLVELRSTTACQNRAMGGMYKKQRARIQYSSRPISPCIRAGAISPRAPITPPAHLVQVEGGRLAPVVVVAVDVEHLRSAESPVHACRPADRTAPLAVASGHPGRAK